MPVPTPQEYAEMLDAAASGGYAYPAINITSSLTLNAAIEGFTRAGSDGIVQATVGGAAFIGGGSDNAVGGARALALMTRELARRAPVRIALHTDHCPLKDVDPFLVPLLEASEERVAAGDTPLFNSHMFDGSNLELAENLRHSRELLERYAAIGIVLEVEVGVVGGEEDGIAAKAGAELYTTNEDLLETARVLGTGEHGRYLLAATFGNVHGLYAPGHVQLRPEILRDGQAALAEQHPGARFEYVFHGSSGSTDEELSAAVSYGVVKVNLDTEAQYAFTRPIAGHMFAEYDGVLAVDGNVARKAAFDPRSWGAKGIDGMAERVAQSCRQLGSAGRSLGAAASSTAQVAGE